MASQSPTEKIAELRVVVAQLAERLSGLIETEKLHSEESKNQDQRHEVVRKSLEESRIENAVLKSRVEELAKHKDETGRRVWQLIFIVTGVILGSLMTLLLKR